MMVSLRNLAAKLDTKSNLKLHDQLYCLLKNALDEHQLDEVSYGRFPAQRKMASMLGVSRETVSKAVFKLVQDGYLSASEHSCVFLRTGEQSEDVDGAKPATDKRFDGADGCKQQRETRVCNSSAFVAVPRVGYVNGYHIEKFLKTLRKQSARKREFLFDSCGLVSLRNTVCSQVMNVSGINCKSEEVVVFPDFRACIDFIIRLLTKAHPTCIVDAYGSVETRALLDLFSLRTVEIPVDKEGARSDLLQSLQISNAVYFASPRRHDPMGISLSQSRIDKLTDWADSTSSVLVELSDSQEFLLKPASLRCIYVWLMSTSLKPWVQTCCAIFPPHFVREAQKLKSTIGGEAAVNEQRALSEFVSRGDLLLTEKHRELANRKKRQELERSLIELFKSTVEVFSGNTGSRMVFEVSPEADFEFIVESIKKCGLPLRLVDGIQEHELLVIDLDLVNAESLAGKLRKLKQVCCPF